MRLPSWLVVWCALAAPACGFRPVTGSDAGVMAPDLAPAPDLGGGRSLFGDGAVTLASIDLTQLGTRDWAHFGYLGPGGVDRKRGVMPVVGPFAGIGSGVVDDYDNNSVAYAWSDGDAHATVSATNSGVYVVGAGQGFSLSVPATLDLATVELFVGGYRSRGALHVELSGTPTLGYDDDNFSRDLDGDQGIYNATYTLRFRGDGVGQALSLTWRAESLSASDGNVTLQAIALH